MESPGSRQRQIPNFAWSSQGRGFFTDRAGRGKLDDEEIVRCWYSEKNFERRDRAIELASKLGRSPIHIALAYVLAQPFPVVPLIGPRTLVELEDSLSALDIQPDARAGRLARQGLMRAAGLRLAGRAARDHRAAVTPVMAGLVPAIGSC